MKKSTLDVGGRIRAVLGAPKARELVAIYFDPESKFSGVTFDTVGTNDPNRIGIDDLLALSMLDVAVKPRGVRAVLGPSARDFTRLLKKVPFNRDLWEASDADLAHAAELDQALRTLDGVEWVTASKLLARKRPRLIPVTDKHVVAALQLPKGRYWGSIASALAAGELWREVEELRGPLSRPVTTLRLLDVAIWTRFSESRNAREARVRCG